MSQIIEVKSKPSGDVIQRTTLWAAIGGDLTGLIQSVAGVDVTIDGVSIVRHTSVAKVEAETRPIAIPDTSVPAGEMTIMDALRYIRKDLRFHARPRSWQIASIKFSEDTKTFRFVPEGHECFFREEFFFGPWELVKRGEVKGQAATPAIEAFSDVNTEGAV